MKLPFWRILRILALMLFGVVALALAIALLVYPPVYVFRVMAWQESDVFDWQKFPSHLLQAAPEAYHFEVALDPRVDDLFKRLSGAFLRRLCFPKRCICRS